MTQQAGRPETRPRDPADRVAFLGTGAMGGRVATRLLQAGHQVTVWNRSPDKAAALSELGAEVAPTSFDAARGASMVITMLRDDDAVLAVHRDLADHSAIASGTVVVEMSTVGPRCIEHLRDLLPPEHFLIDAPVLGSLAEAECGTLTILVGADHEALTRCLPILCLLGNVHHVGGLGDGAAAKLVANNALLGSVTLLGETLALGCALGLERGQVFDLLDHTPLAGQARRRRSSVEAGSYPARFALEMAGKDGALILESWRHAGIEAHPLSSAVDRWLRSAQAAGRGAEDYTALIDHILNVKGRP